MRRDAGPVDDRDDDDDAPEAGGAGMRELRGEAELGQVERAEHDQQRQAAAA